MLMDYKFIRSLAGNKLHSTTANLVCEILSMKEQLQDLIAVPDAFPYPEESMQFIYYRTTHIRHELERRQAIYQGYPETSQPFIQSLKELCHRTESPILSNSPKSTPGKPFKKGNYIEI